MGTYLYAIRKLKKPQRIAREDERPADRRGAEVVRDWLYSITPVRPAPEHKLPAPVPPTHEECMRAAGWL